MVATCRVCLCSDSDRRMHPISNTVFVKVWEKLTNAKFDTNDGKPLLVCYICSAQLRKAHQLMKNALKAEELLTAVINNGSKQSQKAILLLASQTLNFQYNYAIGEVCQFECKQFGRNVCEIKKENEWGYEEEIDININEKKRGNAEEEIEKEYVGEGEDSSEKKNDINIEEDERSNAEEKIEKENVGEGEESSEKENYTNIKEDERGNAEEENEKENVGESEEGNEEENDINVKEEERGNAEEEVEKENVGEGEESSEKENDINIKEEERGNAEEEIEKENVGESEEGSEEENDINIKEEEDCSDSNREEIVHISDVESGPLLSGDMLLKDILEREVRIILEKIDIGPSATKRKSNEVRQKGKLIKLDEIKESTKCLTDTAVKNLSNNNKKTSDAVASSTSLDGSDGRKISSIRNLRIEPKGRFSCHICQYKCFYNYLLNRHLRTHTGEKLYICDFCDYRFTRKYNLMYHIKYKHTKEKNFSCHICQYKCIRKCDLNRHVFKHTGEKPYICDYRSSRKLLLEDHIKYKHTKEKNFSRHICQFKCTTKYELTLHLRTHTGEKPYICDFCDYRSARKNDLKYHIQRKHNKERKGTSHVIFASTNVLESLT